MFPPRLLSSDCEELFSNFVLTVAGEYTQDYEVPELPQVVFLAMLLNDVVKLSVLRGWMIRVMESTLKELRWMQRFINYFDYILHILASNVLHFIYFPG